MKIRSRKLFSAMLWLALAAVSMPAAGQTENPFAGQFSGEFNGQPARASLAVQKTAVNCTLDIGGYVYSVNTIQRGELAACRLRDEDGVLVPVEMWVRGDELTVRVLAQGEDSPPVEFELIRGAGPPDNAAARGMDVDPALVGEVSDGERIFDAKCSQFHTFRMARGLLATMPPAKRPEHLVEFLKTHPPKLDDGEKKLVIDALSRPDR
ncbi:MAG TPA: hypothetical protein VMP00_01520 [Burkholderiales bacterium]|nr:hypothetical protein [Burkholderiales bacterium]